MRSIVAIFPVISLFAGAPLFAQIAERSQAPSIIATGEATVTARPDQAQIDIGVVTQAEKAEGAASQNAQHSDAVLAALRAALGRNADVKTINYLVNPNYRYPREGGTPIITGYTATNTVEVTLNDLALVGKAIDAAVQAGANQIQRLQFSLKDNAAAQSQALKEAATQARAKANAIASALGVKIVQVLRAEENVSAEGPRPLQAAELRAAAAPPTPVEPGNINIRARVTLTVGIGQ